MERNSLSNPNALMNTQADEPPAGHTSTKPDYESTIPVWQQKLGDGPGVPMENWLLSEEELIAVIQQKHAQNQSN